MNRDLVSASVVVLAEHHNPTILHPTFLASQKIVPEDWSAVQVLCTPILSTVGYENGMEFTVEPNKLQVTDSQSLEAASESEVANCVLRYVQALPHVKYGAVGLNFVVLLGCDHPAETLATRFLARGPWNTPQLPLQKLGLRFVYSVGESVLRLSCDPGSARRGAPPVEKSGIVVRANYHTPVAEGDFAAVQTAVSSVGEKWEHLSTLIKMLFEDSLE